MNWTTVEALNPGASAVTVTFWAVASFSVVWAMPDELVSTGPAPMVAEPSTPKVTGTLAIDCPAELYTAALTVTACPAMAGTGV